jgi:hypothetical protein
MGEKKIPHTDKKEDQHKTQTKSLNANLQASQTPHSKGKTPHMPSNTPIIVEGGDMVTVRVRAPRGRLGMFSRRDDRGDSG